MSVKIDIAASHRERIGCSRIAQALGVSRWGSRLELWEQYTGRAERPDIGSELRVALGEPMEEVLKPFVAARLGRALRRDHREYLHPDLPLVGHVDYRAEQREGESKRPVLDMKTSLGFGARHRFGADGSDEVDDDVLLQMQGYLMLTGAETAFVAALVPGPELKLYEVAADPEIHAMIAQGIREFWNCVQTDTPPPPQTAADLARLHPVDDGGTVTATAEILKAIGDLKEANGTIKDLEGTRKGLEFSVKEHLGDAATLVDMDGKPLATWKTQNSNRLDQTRLKAEDPETYARFTTTSTSRVLRIK